MTRARPRGALPPSWRSPGEAPMAFEDFPGSLLAVALAAVQRQVTTPLIAQHDLGMSAWRTLTFVALLEPVSAATIAQRSTLDKALISRAIRELEARGLIVREEGSGATRPLRTTRKGRLLFDDLFAQVQQGQARLIALLPASQRKAVYLALRQWAAKPVEAAGRD